MVGSALQPAPGNMLSGQPTANLVPSFPIKPMKPNARTPSATLQSQSQVSTAPVHEADLRKAAAQAALSLKTRGWANIEGVLSKSDCLNYEDGFWEWIEGLGSGVRRDDPATWRAPAWPPSFRGIINSLEVAHQAFVWKVRKHPRLVKIFEELWGSNALLSSFDSINALPPTDSPPTEAWLHVDQAPWREGVCCVQGLVNLVDVSPETTGTLLVKDGSAEAHHSFFSQTSKMPREEQLKIGDHYKFTPEELPYWDAYRSVGVSGKAGSLFLWDSRAVHANVFPAATSHMRHVVYTCFQPASLASPANLEEKRAGYRDYRLTTHWPAMNIKTYDAQEAVEYYGVAGSGDVPQYKMNRTREAVEDRRLLQLAGMLNYTAEEAQEREPLLNMSVEELAILAS